MVRENMSKVDKTTYVSRLYDILGVLNVQKQISYHKKLTLIIHLIL